MFVPVALEEVGCSATPWVNLNVSSLQGCVDTVYPGIDYTVRKGDPLESSVSFFFFTPLRPTYPCAGKLPGHGLPQHDWNCGPNQRQELFGQV